MTPSLNPDVKKPPIPNTFLKAYTVVQHLVKNKIKASSNQNTVENYSLYVVKYMLENKIIYS